MAKILTLPDSHTAPLTIRAKALVFHDPQSRLLLDHVERLARSDATVLVTGETGTGKELIARHIHATSGRAGPFVAVNCGAFSETLIDAELFGHEAGAFTGASHARAGWFESANGGTLFLDEIGDLPMALQVKLLRVLQERQVVRLGSRRPIPLDVRLVAATNIDLARAVAAQHFRADLYYRLSVAGVRLPALHARQADILPLAEHFIGVYCNRLGIRTIPLSHDAGDALRRYSWPGNIRELENVIHYALIVCAGDEIQASDLKLVPLLPPVDRRAGAASPEPAPGYGGYRPPVAEAASPPSAPVPAADARSRLPAVFDELLREGGDGLFDAVERALVHAAFEHAQRNQVRSARALGVTRNMVRTLLKRHGLLAAGAIELDGEGESVDDAASAGSPFTLSAA
ncbi:sigma-54 interaction domain-containing protein [Scleromatobacter humisilvae]|uniref:Sigma-54 dependent transcriptional regulator n=1 Tax=Scleromatobacter humisilvae TaxID=2897159 RepID=A0A9X1YM39_9BURK|nr:sigma-54 dependent transcriptional regulator [Scleromatobacter humisilvae]MCK9687400.1 sigma-54 dependent transcriptional regulator [Scleromatobacter humisilvae]